MNSWKFIDRVDLFSQRGSQKNHTFSLGHARNGLIELLNCFRYFYASVLQYNLYVDVSYSRVRKIEEKRLGVVTSVNLYCFIEFFHWTFMVEKRKTRKKDYGKNTWNPQYRIYWFYTFQTIKALKSP